MGEQAPVSTQPSKCSSSACGLTPSKGMAKEALLQSGALPRGGKDGFSSPGVWKSEGALQEGGVLACWMHAQGQVHMPALGRVSATATRAVSQVSYRACFGWDGEQSHQRGLPHPGQREPGMEGGVWAPAESPGDSQGQGVLQALSPTWTYSVVTGVMRHNWSTAVDGCKLFRRDRHGGTGSGVAPYIREGFDF